MDNAKSFLWMLLTILIWSIVMFGAGHYWTLGTLKNETTSDTTRTVQMIPQPPDSGKAQVKPRTIALDYHRADNLLQLSPDSLRTILAMLAAKREITVQSDRLGLVKIEFDPLNELATHWTAALPPVKLEVVKIKETQTITVERSWIETVGLVAAGAGIGYFVASLHK